MRIWNYPDVWILDDYYWVIPKCNCMGKEKKHRVLTKHILEFKRCSKCKTGYWCCGVFVVTWCA